MLALTIASLGAAALPTQTAEAQVEEPKKEEKTNSLVSAAQGLCAGRCKGRGLTDVAVRYVIWAGFAAPGTGKPALLVRSRLSGMPLSPPLISLWPANADTGATELGFVGIRAFPCAFAFMFAFRRPIANAVADAGVRSCPPLAPTDLDNVAGHTRDMALETVIPPPLWNPPPPPPPKRPTNPMLGGTGWTTERNAWHWRRERGSDPKGFSCSG